jgi:hypothetical protein
MHSNFIRRYQTLCDIPKLAASVTREMMTIEDVGEFICQ